MVHKNNIIPHIKKIYTHNHSIFKSHASRFDQSTTVNEETYKKYLQMRKRPKDNLKYFGFHSFDHFLDTKEIENLQEYVASLEMESTEWGQTFREGAIIKVDGYKYTPVAMKQMPEILKKIGNRILDFLRANKEYSENACFKLPDKFDQAYIQKYKPEGELNPHFDDRSKFQEIIAGITICGHSNLVLGLHQAAKASKKIKSGVTDQLYIHNANAGQLYVMSGMSRYDFRHAVYNSTNSTRISITFRALSPDMRKKLTVQHDNSTSS